MYAFNGSLDHTHLNEWITYSLLNVSRILRGDFNIVEYKGDKSGGAGLVVCATEK